MCSNRKTLACISSNRDQSILSDTYRRPSSKPMSSNPSQNLAQIQIKFKNKLRLLTAIEETTTFDELKLVLIISSYKKRLSKSDQTEQDQLKKYQKNYDGLKKMATDDYVICECVNENEKMIDSSQRVQGVLKRISKEAIFLGKDFKVTHSMRLKRSLARLAPEPWLANKVVKSSRPIPILDEFYIEDEAVGSGLDEVTYENMESSSDIDKQLRSFDKYIQHRKKYIELLEEYIALTNDLEADLMVDTNTNKAADSLTSTMGSCELESSDTGFSSVEGSVSSEKFNDWCVEKSVVTNEENRQYYTRISNFETYV